MARRRTKKTGDAGKFGFFLLVLGLVGFTIEYGWLNLPFWPTLLVVAGLWKMLLKGM